MGKSSGKPEAPFNQKELHGLSKSAGFECQLNFEQSGPPFQKGILKLN